MYVHVCTFNFDKPREIPKSVIVLQPSAQHSIGPKQTTLQNLTYHQIVRIPSGCETTQRLHVPVKLKEGEAFTIPKLSDFTPTK